jgi:hypothetical protein
VRGTNRKGRAKQIFTTKGTKFTKEGKNEEFDLNIKDSLGELVPIFHKTNHGNRYYTDLFKIFIEGRHGSLGGESGFETGLLGGLDTLNFEKELHFIGRQKAAFIQGFAEINSIVLPVDFRFGAESRVGLALIIGDGTFVVGF